MTGITGLHHHAWRCRDAAETRAFYEGRLGFPLVHAERSDGPHGPVLHMFFALPDGTFLVFIDLGDGQPVQPSPNTPAGINHLSLAVASLEQVDAVKASLEVAGIAVTGPVDYVMSRSIYLTDPNGLLVEVAATRGTPTEVAARRDAGLACFDAWLGRSG
ncbi:VOC family protein [Zavarzinia sp. CC-PAN008]|uniref:VOC family protein n=1 Tax=Zavarzinia sp. CC-PAN008 TaxID=3243332 RepID=UPI003F7424AB